jgi:hypothetical protein
MSGQRQPEEDAADDPLFDAMSEFWEHIVVAYKQFEDNRPIMLYDIQEKRIYAYEYEGFKSEMSPKSQASVADQYEQAGKSGKMVVFVKEYESFGESCFTLRLNKGRARSR